GAKHSIAWNTFHKAWESLWRTDPTAILAENSDIGSSTMDLVAQSRMAKQQASERTQMAIRPEPDPAMSGQSAPVTRIVEAPREQLRQE
ncbi:MAG: hypothetical protein H7Z17_00345, partial [Fuerstia sp.]|nr:hypothetical protein [Fuerstiella sp.]